jgi:hypothetical protein
VPGNAFELHLPIGELTRFAVSSSAYSHLVPDCSHHCLIAHRYHDSRAEKNHWFVHHLLKPDWPSFCHNCHSMVMHTVLPLHSQSLTFCKHARDASELNSGILTRCRFSHYPGHPLTHLFLVGKWPVSALAKLHLEESIAKTMLFVNYHRALALSISLYGFFELNVQVLRCVISFLCSKQVPTCKRYSELLDAILDLVLCSKSKSAKRVVCLFSRTSRRTQQSDRFVHSLL